MFTEEEILRYGKTNVDIISEKLIRYVSKKEQGIVLLERDLSIPREYKNNQIYHVNLKNKAIIALSDEERDAIMNNDGVIHQDKILKGYLDSLLITLSQFGNTFNGPDRIEIRILPADFYRVKVIDEI